MVFRRTDGYWSHQLTMSEELGKRLEQAAEEDSENGVGDIIKMGVQKELKEREQE